MSTLSIDRLPAQCPTPFMSLINVEDFLLTTTGSGPGTTLNLTLDVMTYNCRGRMVELSLWWAADLQTKSFPPTAATPLVKQTFAAFEGQTPHTLSLAANSSPDLTGASARPVVVAFAYPLGHYVVFSDQFKLEQPNRCDQGAGLAALFLTNDKPRYAGNEKFAPERYKGWRRLLLNQVCTPLDRIVLSAMQAVEGYLDAVQAADSELVSVGFMQKTVSLDPNKVGELPPQLWTFKQAEPTRFACLLQNAAGKGWDVTGPSTITYTDPDATDKTVYSRRNNNLGDLRDKIRNLHKSDQNLAVKGRKKNSILDPLVRLGQDEAFQERQLLDARDRLHGVLDAYPYGRDTSQPTKKQYYTNEATYFQKFRVGAYFQSDIGQVFLLNHHVNRPGQPLYYVGAALDTFFDKLPWATLGLPTPARDPATWPTTPDPHPTNPRRPISLRARYERELIWLYAQSLYDVMPVYLDGGADKQKGVYDDIINKVKQKTRYVRQYEYLKKIRDMSWLPATPRPAVMLTR